MEYINRIEIRGKVGKAEVTPVDYSRFARLSVATEDVLSSSGNGGAIIERTWHTVTAWEAERTAGAFNAKEGDTVQVTGRLRIQKYTAADGSTRSVSEIVANKVDIITEG